MITILHGDNQKLSRDKRTTSVQVAKAKGQDIKELAGDKLTRSELESVLLTENLFGAEYIVIDGLLSRLRSKEKTILLDYLISAPTKKDILLWDKREVTPATLKLFTGKAKVEIFKASKYVFKLADELRPGNAKKCLEYFHASLQDDEVFMTFGMLSRRTSDLIIASTSPDKLVGAPWIKSTIISQAKFWQINNLLAFHAKLLDIDYKTKTGGTKLDLVIQVDMLLMSL